MPRDCHPALSHYNSPTADPSAPWSYLVLHSVTDTAVPFFVSGTPFYTATEATEIVGVSRQSLWRWRRDSLVPCGRRYRGRELLYTRDEVEAIYAHAHRLERADAAERLALQLDLFSSPAPSPTGPDA